MDPPLSPPGLFGDTMNPVIKRFQEAEKQLEAFKRYLPYRAQVSGAAGREQSQPLTSSSYRVGTALSDEAS